LTTFSSEDMLQKYLSSQSKLSTMVHKRKQKMLCTKKESETIMERTNPIETSTEKSNKESGSEYFPSTDSGKRKCNPTVKY